MTRLKNMTDEKLLDIVISTSYDSGFFPDGSKEQKEAIKKTNRTSKELLSRIKKLRAEDDCYPIISRMEATISALSDKDREELFENVLPSLFCMHCGSKNPHCQCWNDE